MTRFTKEKLYIKEERMKIVFERFAKGFTESDIARMLNVNRSVVTRIIADNKQEYMKWFLTYRNK